jgi:hypothetical protein
MCSRSGRGRFLNRYCRSRHPGRQIVLRILTSSSQTGDTSSTEISHGRDPRSVAKSRPEEADTTTPSTIAARTLSPDVVHASAIRRQPWLARRSQSQPARVQCAKPRYTSGGSDQWRPEAASANWGQVKSPTAWPTTCAWAWTAQSLFPAPRFGCRADYEGHPVSHTVTCYIKQLGLRVLAPDGDEVL